MAQLLKSFPRRAFDKIKFLARNKIIAIESESFVNTPSSAFIDLSENVCIDGAFSKAQLEEALTTKCQPESGQKLDEEIHHRHTCKDQHSDSIGNAGVIVGGKTGFWYVCS